MDVDFTTSRQLQQPLYKYAVLILNLHSNESVDKESDRYQLNQYTFLKYAKVFFGY